MGISETEITNKASLHVFYNAAAEKLFINAQNFKGKYCTLQIFDVMGRKVFSSRKKIQPHYFTHDINCAALAKGMYIINLQTEKENLSKKFIKE
ncbi:MAG TPA: T9SS type A sorting domain-containing protein [Bacteroidia bacterium]|nr:T9SS type A sorting domain-containing protein [Bacteroidia bacterium]